LHSIQFSETADDAIRGKEAFVVDIVVASFSPRESPLPSFDEIFRQISISYIGTKGCIVSASGTDDHRFESRQGVNF
jgi:hypothetical protein